MKCSEIKKNQFQHFDGLKRSKRKSKMIILVFIRSNLFLSSPAVGARLYKLAFMVSFYSSLLFLNPFLVPELLLGLLSFSHKDQKFDYWLISSLTFIFISFTFTNLKTGRSQKQTRTLISCDQVSFISSPHYWW